MAALYGASITATLATGPKQRVESGSFPEVFLEGQFLLSVRNSATVHRSRVG